MLMMVGLQNAPGGEAEREKNTRQASVAADVYDGVLPWGACDPDFLSNTISYNMVRINTGSCGSAFGLSAIVLRYNAS